MSDTSALLVLLLLVGAFALVMLPVIYIDTRRKERADRAKTKMKTRYIL